MHAQEPRADGRVVTVRDRLRIQARQEALGAESLPAPAPVAEPEELVGDQRALYEEIAKYSIYRHRKFRWRWSANSGWSVDRQEGAENTRATQTFSLGGGLSWSYGFPEAPFSLGGGYAAYYDLNDSAEQGGRDRGINQSLALQAHWRSSNKTTLDAALSARLEPLFGADTENDGQAFSANFGLTGQYACSARAAAGFTLTVAPEDYGSSAFTNEIGFTLFTDYSLRVTGKSRVGWYVGSGFRENSTTGGERYVSTGLRLGTALAGKVSLGGSIGAEYRTSASGARPSPAISLSLGWAPSQRTSVSAGLYAQVQPGAIGAASNPDTYGIVLGISQSIGGRLSTALSAGCELTRYPDASAPDSTTVFVGGSANWRSYRNWSVGAYWRADNGAAGRGAAGGGAAGVNLEAGLRFSIAQ